MTRSGRRLLLASGVLAALAALTAAAPALAATGVRDPLRAGVGTADITPQTEYFLGGWTRADRLGRGVHTRLFANALVLQRGPHKVALVAADLFAIPGGMAQAVAQAVAGRGFGEQNVVISATHTHSGPGGFANFPTYNTAAPSPSTATDPLSFARLINPAPADVQLYTFLVRRIALAVARADRDRGPAVAGWGHRDLVGLTQNRSIEAHLANFGIHEAYGTGSPGQAPGGYPETIDPNVDVLRVDKLVRRGRRLVHVPIGAWSNFANHGTVTKSEFQAYSGDHHATADRVLEADIRRAGRVPARQAVVNVYGNADEGDQTSGIRYTGPAGADYVGRREAAVMFAAWQSAGRALSATPQFALRWTRICFCGQSVDGGRIASSGLAGVPFLTGSEEGRGPLYDITHVPLEGDRLPVDNGPQGDKLQVPAGGFPNAAPLTVVQIADRIIASVPGEATKQVGLRIKQAVLAATASAGIHQVVLAGLADEYLSYITTPEEYEQQHYEGASTIFGRLEAPFLQQQIAGLAGDLARGLPAPAPHPFDPTDGVRPDGAPYPPGASSGAALAQPSATVPRLGHATFSWQGGILGRDRRLDRAFITAQRRSGGRWVAVDDDLGLDFLWRVTSSGRYDAYWEVPLTAPAGTYRLLVSANRYRLASQDFRVVGLGGLMLERVAAPGGTASVQLRYRPADYDVDLTYRPFGADGGRVRFLVDGRSATVRAGHGSTFSIAVPAGAHVEVPAGGAQDRYGNSNADPLTLS